MKTVKEFATEKPFHWIAVNGSSCAVSPFPLKFPFAVKPTPEWVMGFPTAEEAVEAQQFLLAAPPEQLRPRIAEWMKRSDVVSVRFPNPEPQTDGPTVWAGK